MNLIKVTGNGTQLPLNVEQVTKTLITTGTKIGKGLGERLAKAIDSIIDNLLK